MASAHDDFAAAPSGELASYGRRAVAWVVDFLITPVAPVALYIVVGVTVFDDDVPLGVALLLVVAVVAFQLLYSPLLLQRAGTGAGQTLGKQALGLRVIRTDGDALGFGTALKRELLARSLLGLVPFYTLADLLWPLAHDRRRALHDLLADTVVVTA